MENKNLKRKTKKLILIIRKKGYCNELIEFIKKNPKTINHKDNSGRTPLMYALCEQYNINIIKLLINKKTNINNKDICGNTPLMLALKFQHDYKTIKLIINKKTNINQKDDYGNTPLSFSLYKKFNINIIKLLIDDKTDLNQKDDDGNSSLKSLLKYSEKNIVVILSFFYFYNKDMTVDAMKLILNDSNFKYFLDNPVFIPAFKEKDSFGWNLSDYLFWNKRFKNINYLLILSY